MKQHGGTKEPPSHDGPTFAPDDQLEGAVISDVLFATALILSYAMLHALPLSLTFTA